MSNGVVLSQVQRVGIFDVLDYAPSDAWEFRLAQAGTVDNDRDPAEVWSRLFELVWASAGYAELRDSVGEHGIREPVLLSREPHWHVIDGVRRIVAAAHYRMDVPAILT